jgi:multidrug efflux pump subunit AcrB
MGTVNSTNPKRQIQPKGLIAQWVNWTVSEKKLIYIVILALVTIGIVGIVTMRKNEMPDFQLTQGLVVAVYPGATAKEVEEHATKPLEAYLYSLKEVKRATTTTVTRDGMGYIYVDVRCAQNEKDQVWNKIKLGLQQQKMMLPAGVIAVVTLDDFSNASSMLIAIESYDKSYFELQDYAESLAKSLRKIPETSRVAIVGEQEEEIAVILDREKLSSYGIDPTMIMYEYQTSSLSIPAGTFKTDYVNAAIHVKNTVSSEQEVSDRIVYSDPLGNIVRLKDIATIERRYKKPSDFVSYNGNQCLIVDVSMADKHDIVAYGRKIDKVLAEFQEKLPDSVNISRVSDMPKVVGNSVWSFLRDLLMSMLVVIFVMLMLFPLRSALIASSGVPICTAITIAVMAVTGMPMDTVTLAALIVVLGMIVDDSIITMDGYMDKTSKGFHGIEAASQSAQELFFPTFTATLAISLMFFPIMLIVDGYIGDFVRNFPFIILTALMTSLFYAVSVVPSLEIKYIRINDPSNPKNRFTRIQDSFFNFIQKIYDVTEKWCFKHPIATIGMGVLAIGLGLLMASTLSLQMMPKSGRDHFVVEMYLDGGNGIEKTKEYADSLTSIFLNDDRVKHVTAFVGTGAPRFNVAYAPILPSPQTAQLVVHTKSIKATEEIIREYENKYEHIFPNALIRFKQMDYQIVASPVLVNIYCDDREKLTEINDQIKGYMCSLTKELKWVHSDMDNVAPWIEVELEPDESARMGVNKTLVSLSLAVTYGSQNIATLWDNGRKIPVNIYSTNISDSMSYSNIYGQMVPTTIPGVSVPLRQVADIKPEWRPYQLCRADGENVVNIYADLKTNQSQPKTVKKIKKFIKNNVEVPEDVRIEFGGLDAMNAYVLPQVICSFLAAVGILFVFLLIHFKKTSIAILTMSMSLLCLFGASFGLWIFKMDFSITAVLGLISLVGIIVRNGILMYEYAEDARFNGGQDVKTAAMEAGKRRMRPIFLTSSTTALGVLPMIIRGDALWQPMGVVICFGTMLSIFLITLVMPVSYWQVFKNADNKKEVAV